MSASAIADALVTMLSAASVFGDGNVSKNSYKVMETTAGSCAVVQFVDLEEGPVAFGDQTDISWTHEVAMFGRDTGDPTEALNRVYSMVDVFRACIWADVTLQGTAQRVDAVRAGFTPREALDIGGQTWLPVFAEIDSTEW